MTYLEQAQEWLTTKNKDWWKHKYEEETKIAIAILDFARHLDEQESPKTCGCSGLSPESLHVPFSDSCRLENPPAEIKPPTNYSHISHTHCYEQENPPCGLGNASRGMHCCLCDIVSGEKPTPVPEELEMFERPWHNNPEDDYCEIQDKLNEVIRWARSLQPRNQ